MRRRFMMAMGSVVIFLLATGLIMLAIFDYFSEAQRQELKLQTSMAAQGVELGKLSYLEGLPLGNYRITWIEDNGQILYDSQPQEQEMENHLNRKEVQQALAEGYGESQRYSTTMLEKMIYSAQRLSDGSVIRVSMPQHTIFLFILDMAFPIAIIVMLVCVILVIFSYRQTKKANQEESEQMRREFTANVSHELKSPLHAISGYAELLKSDMVLEGDTSYFASKIYDESQRMIRLVQDIITLSRLDEGEENTVKNKIDLYVLAEAICDELSPLAKEKDVVLEIAGTNVIIDGIPQLLHSMLYNICENGIKYNRPGGSVTISLEKHDRNVIVTIRDTGIGISKSDQKRIFERFYRVDKSHSKSVGGTGLGLSIVKHSVKLHNAKLEIESIVDEGTMFTITF
ncbi:MAG: ATP-binding protein [Selenomonadaceae bacterium]|nr:ATP-binding protein [Selenomonadaceae bacterium]